MINTIKELTVVNWIGDRKGIFQAIVKVPAGFYTAYVLGSELPNPNRWKKGRYKQYNSSLKDLMHGLQCLLEREVRLL
jgi:hypothetical protein